MTILVGILLGSVVTVPLRQLLLDLGDLQPNPRWEGTDDERRRGQPQPAWDVGGGCTPDCDDREIWLAEAAPTVIFRRFLSREV